MRVLPALDQGDLQAAVDHAQERDIHSQRGALEDGRVVGIKEGPLFVLLSFRLSSQSDLP